MKLILTVLFVFLSFFMYSCKDDKKEVVKKYTQEEWNEKMKQQDQESWRVDVKMNHPGLTLHNNVVIHILVDIDPMENFKKNLELMKDYYIKTMDLKDAKRRNISFAWDSIFETVKGNEVSLIANQSEVIWGGNDLKKQWLVTRAISVSDKNVMWSIPLNKQKGETTEITLTPKNAFDNARLEKIYDSIIR